MAGIELMTPWNRYWFKWRLWPFAYLMAVVQWLSSGFGAWWVCNYYFSGGPLWRAWWKGWPAVDLEKGSRQPLTSTSTKRQDGRRRIILPFSVGRRRPSCLFQLVDKIDVDHPDLFKPVDSRRPFYSPFHHAPFETGLENKSCFSLSFTFFWLKSVRFFLINFGKNCGAPWSCGPWWPSGLERVSNSSRHSLEDPGSNPRLGLPYRSLRSSARLYLGIRKPNLQSSPKNNLDSWPSYIDSFLASSILLPFYISYFKSCKLTCESFLVEMLTSLLPLLKNPTSCSTGWKPVLLNNYAPCLLTTPRVGRSNPRGSKKKKKKSILGKKNWSELKKKLFN